MGLVLQIIGFFILSGITIITHEIGHIFYLQQVYPNRNIAITFYYDSWRKFGLKAGKQKDYTDLTNKQYILVNLCGIWSGALFIVAATLVINYYSFLLLAPYLFGCSNDIKQIYLTIKEGL